MKSSQFKLLYFGSDKFSIRILNHLLNKKLCPIEVVTGKQSLLDQYSAQNRIVRHQWPILPNRSAFNIGLVASFGQLIDETTVNLFKYGLFNVHPSLLPQYRGSTPVQAAIRDGIKETGCTIMRIPPIKKFDIGDIILQEQTAIKYREYAIDLRDRLADMGAGMVEKLLNDYDNCIQNSRPQGSGGKSYAKKITYEHGMIKFKHESSETIDRKVRAYTGFTELYSYFKNGLRVKLEGIRDPKELEQYDINRLAASLHRLRGVKGTSSGNIEPGTIHLHKHRQLICIKCADNKWLAFDNMTPEFKSKMSALDFYNGYLSNVDLGSMKTDI